MIIQDYAAYNVWANERYVTWLQGASEAMFRKEMESSFNSLFKTVAHLWNAEHGWLNTLKSESWGTPPGVGFEGSSEELMQGWLSSSYALLEWVSQRKESDLKAEYFRAEGKRIGTAEEILLHVFNHATYHRGQLITLGRQLGLTQPPRADYIYYIQER